jgi:hypothetical protein
MTAPGRTTPRDATIALENAAAMGRFSQEE